MTQLPISRHRPLPLPPLLSQVPGLMRLVGAILGHECHQGQRLVEVEDYQPRDE